jgi:hypothetical protein
MAASFPDNTQGLITPLANRDMVISEAVNVGFLVETGDTYTIPIAAADTWYDMQAPITTPVFVSNFWELDSNNNFVESYTTGNNSFGATVTVNPGTTRLASVSLAIAAYSVGNTSPRPYQLQLRQGGVGVGSVYDFELSSVPDYLSLSLTVLDDVSLRNTYSWWVQGVAQNADLVVVDGGYRISGVPI